MTKSYPYKFTEEELREGYRRTIESVRELLRIASHLLDIKDSQQHALGLYVYAVEEYGKAILLRSYITEKKAKYQIPGWILGKRKPSIKSINGDKILYKLLSQVIGNSKLKSSDTIAAHDSKLLIGSNLLPSECSRITRGISLSAPVSSGKVIDIGSDRKIVPTKGTTGGYSDTVTAFFDPRYSTFFELGLKTSCFYMDFDKNNKTWRYDIVTDEDQLKENIKLFEERLDHLNRHLH
jgi:hypothetical protein